MSRLNSFLQGVRIIDLSRHFPGPLGSMLLADMGAEVIKIEPPAGEEMRTIGPAGPSGRSVYFDAVNAGKSGLRLDLKDGAGRDRFLELVADADICMHSFRPGVMERLGLEDAKLAALNPRLIRCAINGYGHNSPLRTAAGHDANYLALGGLLDRNGSDQPTFFDPPIADASAGLMATVAILGALLDRSRNGRGCSIEVALADAMMPLQAFQLAELSALNHVPRRGAELLNGGAAFYQVYRTGDGRFVTVGAVEPKFWSQFCTAAGRPDWIARQADPLPQTQLMSEVQAMFSGLTRQEAVELFTAADCCFAPVLDLDEAVKSPHYSQRGLLEPGSDGLLQALFPALVDGQPPAGRAPFRDYEDLPAPMKAANRG